MVQKFIDLKNISKVYTGLRALDRVDFDLYKGEIHCLVGENGSGKSTLIKIISGVVLPESTGEIVINEQPVKFDHYSSRMAIHEGIHVIYQDLSLYPNLSVFENIAFNMHVESGTGIVRWNEMKRVARKIMDEIGIRLDLDRSVGSLSIADQQLVAISRALVGETKLLIMDEPTASLTKTEVDSLFKLVKFLQNKGLTTMFVSHKLDEVFKIAERVTIIRDGKKIGTFKSEELDHDKLIQYMSGKKITYSKLCSTEVTGSALLEVKNLSKKGNFRNINFTLHRGEILGITGLLGSGRTELVQSLFGLNPAEEGKIYIETEQVKIKSISDAVKAGIGYVPENRLAEGLVQSQSISKNIVITVLKKLLNKAGFIKEQELKKTVEQGIGDFSIKIPSPESPVSTLSGGNAQRVVIAKWMATGPKILILDGPTIGVDVSAKSSIHEIVQNYACNGNGVIIISDEIHEVLYNCHRVLIMNKGRIVDEFIPETTTEEDLAQNQYLSI